MSVVDLSARTVLVTGGAAGVGRGIALACGVAGAHVVIASRRENGGEVVDEIVRAGARRRGHSATSPTANRSRPTVARAVERTGGLHTIVHNATSNRSSEPHRLEDISIELLDEHAAVSLRGAFHCAHAARPALAQSHGTLIVMTSPAGIEGSATLPMYATMKGALRGFAKSLAREWAPFGITVNVVSPLAFSPAMVNAIAEDPDMEGRLNRRVPLGRVGDPETDVGPGVAFLVSADAAYITGQTLGVDGGHFMSL